MTTKNNKTTTKTDDLNQVGVMFMNTSKNGTKYFNGTINDMDVVGFVSSFTSKAGNDVTVMNVYEAQDLEASTSDSKTKTTKSSSKTKKDLPF